MARTSTAKTTLTEIDAPVPPTQSYDQAAPAGVDKNAQYTAARSGIKAVVDTLTSNGSYPSDAASICASVGMEELYNQSIGYTLRNLAELRHPGNESLQRQFVEEVLTDEQLGGFRSTQIRFSKIISVNPLMVTIMQVQSAGQRIRGAFSTELNSDEMQALRDKRKRDYEASQAQG